MKKDVERREARGLAKALLDDGCPLQDQRGRERRGRRAKAQLAYQGCLVWVLIGLLALALMGCAISDVARRALEPVDRNACMVSCRRCEYFSRYVYETDSCFCTCQGVEVQIY